jgi:serine/threonine-protein kinase
MDDGDVRRIDGTEGAVAPEISPDGRWIVFTVDRVLKKVPVDGGTAQVLADSAIAPTWLNSTTILYTRNTQSLWIVDVNGGEPRLLTHADTARGHRFYAGARALPGGRAALLTILMANRTPSRIGAVSIADGNVTEVGVNGTNAEYSEPGYIVYHRGDGVLLAAPFSLRSLKVTGEPVRVADGVLHSANDVPDFTTSNNGVLAYRWRPGGVGGAPTTLSIVDSTGRSRPIRTGDARTFTYPQISHDGRRVALRAHATNFSNGDIWILELATGGLTRFTTDNESVRATWSRDGQRLFFLKGIAGQASLVSRRWDGSGSDSVLLTMQGLAEFAEGIPGGWSAIRTMNPRDIFLVPTDSLATGRRVPFVQSSANDTEISISPDGRWMSYTSDETGRREVYVRPVPGPGPRVLVSLDGGRYGVWSRDGATLYYRGDDWIRAARVTTRGEFAVRRRDSLFAISSPSEVDIRNFAPIPSGGFIILSGFQGDAPIRLEMIANWPSLLRRLRPSN